MKTFIRLRIFAAAIAVVFAASCSQPIDSGRISTVEGSRSAAWSGSPVRLASAKPFQYAVSGMSWDLVFYSVHVKNIGYAADRVVSIHANVAGAWTSVPMVKSQDFGDYSLYTLDTLGGSRKEFVVRYDTTFGTYWDNNGGSNYKVQPWQPSAGFVPGAVGGNVSLTRASVSTTAVFTGTGWTQVAQFAVELAVENLNYAKRVGIRYSLDSGATWYDADGRYLSTDETGGSKLERWKVEVSGPSTSPYGGFALGTNVRFAAYYKDLDRSKEYWDNNFNQDYSIVLVPTQELK